MEKIMKYKVGDKVKVRNDLSNGPIAGIYVNLAMTSIRNTYLTIKSIEYNLMGYTVKENNHFWVDEMFEDNMETTMKYKVGDKVKVRNDLEPGNSYGATFFTKDMEKFKNKWVTILEVGDYSYLIEENDWSWSDEMFEDKMGYEIESSNLMPKIAELLNVKMEENLCLIDNNNNIINKNVKLTDNGLQDKSGLIYYSALTDLLTGNIKTRWIPNLINEYYISNITSVDLYSCLIYKDTDKDNHMIKYNLCFKTKEEAIAKSKEILRKLEE
jgi:hypothetical protein